MGGTFTVVLRKLDSGVVSMERSTNALPGWVCRRDLIEDPQKWQDEFIKSWEEGPFEDAPIAPAWYGLVVIDLVDRLILECNGYSDLHSVINRRAPIDWFLANGRVRRIVEPPDSQGCEYVWAQADPITDRESTIRRWNDFATASGTDVYLDLSPFRVLHYNGDSKAGYVAMRDRVREMFPLTPEDEAAWDEFLAIRYQEGESL